MGPKTPQTPQFKPAQPSKDAKESLALSLLSRAHSPERANQIFTEKVVQRPLYLKPTEPSLQNGQKARRLARQRTLESRRKKLKPKPLSSRQKRALCIYDIPKSQQKYSIYEPLHNMWVGYIHEVLGEGRPVTAAAAAKLCSADYHGAELEVARSRCVGRVGVKGIVVKDGKFSFELITKNNKLKLIPKEHTIFRFRVPPLPGKNEEGKGKDSTLKDEIVGEEKKSNEEEKDLMFELHGDQFIFRAADRANKKFKGHYLPDL
ncbi:ribonuclease P complex subunit Pop4 [Tricladium varicosporioides]|nr:ribonuclease P complex subunit Pop4 [Hymenoscyphus varicosporioides]